MPDSIAPDELHLNYDLPVMAVNASAKDIQVTPDKMPDKTPWRPWRGVSALNGARWITCSMGASAAVTNG